MENAKRRTRNVKRGTANEKYDSQMSTNGKHDAQMSANVNGKPRVYFWGDGSLIFADPSVRKNVLCVSSLSLWERSHKRYGDRRELSERGEGVVTN